MVIVDSDEKVKDRVIPALVRNKVPYAVQRLPAGDYYIPSLALGVERKSTNDFVGSIDNVGDQLRRCSDLYDHVVLLIEGSFSYDFTSGFLYRREGDQRVPSKIKYRDVQKRIFAFAWEHGVHILWSNGVEDSALWLVGMHELAAKPIRKVLGYNAQSPEMRVRNIYASIPGIGEELSKRVFDAFPVPPIPTRWARRLTRVEGIGERKVKDIEAFLSGSWRKEQTTLEEHDEGRGEDGGTGGAGSGPVQARIGEAAPGRRAEGKAGTARAKP